MRSHGTRFLALVDEAKARISELDVAQTLRALQGASPPVLIDCREAHEFQAGHAEGAEHLSKGVLERDIEARHPDPETPIVLYCGGGYRSALAADALQGMGYRQVWSLAGGWRAWCAASAPTHTPD